MFFFNPFTCLYRLPGVAKPLTLRIKVQPAANPSEPNEPQSARMDDDHTDFYTDFKPLHSARGPDEPVAEPVHEEVAEDPNPSEPNERQSARGPDDDDRTWWRLRQG